MKKLIFVFITIICSLNIYSQSEGLLSNFFPAVYDRNIKSTEAKQEIFTYVKLGETIKVEVEQKINTGAKYLILVEAPDGSKDTSVSYDFNSGKIIYSKTPTSTNQEGIWKFIIDRDYNFDSILRIEWDLGVFNSSGALIKGRTFVEKLFILNGAGTNVVKADLYAMTEAGYIFNYEFNNYIGINSAIFFDSKGVVKDDNLCNSEFKSRACCQPGYVAGNCPTIYRLYFNSPDPTMPQIAKNHKGLNTWLYPSVKSINLDSTKSKALVPPTGNYENTEIEFYILGDSTFNYNGVATVFFDLNNDGIFDANDVILNKDITYPGKYSVLWDGKDQNGSLVTQKKVQVKIILNSSIAHLTLLDVEGLGGINVKDVRPGTAGFLKLYWDDRFVDSIGKGNTTPIINGTEGVQTGIATGVHGWGYGDNTFNSWGNLNYIDNWTVLGKGDIEVDITICSTTIGGMGECDDFDGDGYLNKDDLDDDNDGILDVDEGFYEGANFCFQGFIQSVRGKEFRVYSPGVGYIDTLFTIPYEINGIAFSAYDGFIYGFVANDNSYDNFGTVMMRNDLVQVNLKTGKSKLAYSLPQLPDDGVVICGDFDSTNINMIAAYGKGVYKINILTGKFDTITQGNWATSDIVEYNNKIYGVALRNSVVQLWSYDLSLPNGTPAFVSINGFPLVDYVGTSASFGGAFKTINRTTGEKKLYFACNQGGIYSIDINDSIKKVDTILKYVGLSDTMGINDGTYCRYADFGVFLPQDYDGDSIPNYFDLDSDGDGCPDALEGLNKFTLSEINSDGSLPLPVDSNGVPTVVNGGQGIGTALDSNHISQACVTTDTIVDTPGCYNCPIKVCPIINDVDTTGGSISSCSTPDQYTLVGPDNSGCITFTPKSSVKDTQIGCILICDSIGVCDTTIIIIVPPLITTDTIIEKPDCDTCRKVICPKNDDIDTINSTSSLCNTPTGYKVVGPDEKGCYTFIPDGKVNDTVETCIITCTEAGRCDTTVIILLPPPPGVDTVYLKPACKTCSVIACPVFDDIDTTGAAKAFCTPPSGYIVSGPDAKGCYTFTPNGLVTITQSTCISGCQPDGRCDTTVFIVLPPDPKKDTVKVTPPCDVCPVIVCPINDDINTKGNTTTNSCGTPSGYTITGPDVNGCYTYTPNGSVKTDVTTCIITCDETGRCDTTVVIISKPPSSPDTIIIDPPCPTCGVVICPFNDDIDTTGGKTSFSGDIAGYDRIGPDSMGCYTFKPKGTITGPDTIIIITIDTNGRPDTTVVIINPPIPGKDITGQIPNVITPNGDGNNDVFEIKPITDEYPKANLVVYNRWGNAVYRSVGPYKNDWSGENSVNGQPVPDGVYFYIIELGDNFKQVKTGFIQIMRQ